MPTSVAKPKGRPRVAHRPLTAEQRHELQDVDTLLKELIRQNRLLRTRIDRISKAFTSIGEDEIDRLLKRVQKRLHA